MAGNGDGKFVRRTRSGHRTCRLRGSNTPRDLSIANRLAYANLSERLPHTLLKGRAADVKWKVEADRGRFDKADNSRNQSLVIVIGANEMRLRETILEVADELIRVIPQQ